MKTKLSIRQVEPSDAPYFERYWAQTTQADLDRMGEVARPVGSVEFLNQFCADRLPPKDADEGILVWMRDDHPIGYASLKQIRYGNEAQIHLHMWDQQLRGKGLSAAFFCLSALKFIDDFKLEKLYCQPKADNPMPNRMLARIGFALVGTAQREHRGHGLVVTLNSYLISKDVIEKYLSAAPHRGT